MCFLKIYFMLLCEKEMIEEHNCIETMKLLPPCNPIESISYKIFPV